MKVLATGAVVLACLGMAACAGSAQMRRGDGPQSRVDVNKVETVNEWAAKRFATVVWVNYPQLAAEGRPRGE
jgi:hypothetical protein